MGSIAVISDIHGNVTALEAVLENIKYRGIHTFELREAKYRGGVKSKK